MPNETDGATPQLLLCTTSRPGTSDDGEHRGHAHRGAGDRIERRIGVDGDARIAGVAAAERRARERLRLRRLRDEIDRAAGAAASRDGAGRTLHHFDLLEIEGVARVRAALAHAVEQDVVARAESAHAERVARNAAAALPRLERDARRVAQHVAQRRRALREKDFIGNDRDRARSVEQRLRELRRSDLRRRSRDVDRVGHRRQREHGRAASCEAMPNAALGQQSRERLGIRQQAR